MAIIYIDDIKDSRLTVYRNLKDKTIAAQHGLFVVEGEHLVLRLLASDFAVHSVFISQARLDSKEWTFSQATPVYTTSPAFMSQVVGFKFHRGVLAMGVRKPLADVNRLSVVQPPPTRLVVCPEINDVENLGSIMRTAAALGYEHLLLGPSCCDPFARRAIRTSMGAVFKLSIFRSGNIVSDMQKLKEKAGFVWHAAVPDKNAEILENIAPPEKVGVVFGAEAHGLKKDILTACDVRVAIPMADNIDSLNVAVAAGIFLHHYRDVRW